MDKCDEFNYFYCQLSFSMLQHTCFSFLWSTLVFVSTVHQYALTSICCDRACYHYRNFIKANKLLINQLLTHRFCEPELIKTLKKLYVITILLISLTGGTYPSGASDLISLVIYIPVFQVFNCNCCLLLF